MTFIQFYHKVKWIGPQNRTPYSEHYVLENGFGCVWDDVQPEWVLIEKGKPIQLPKNDGDIYASVFTPPKVKKMWKLAIQNPEVHITIGGPAIWPNTPTWCDDVPPNLTIKLGMAESLIGKIPTIDTWKLIPPILDAPIMYSYPIRDDCYWGKCRFCCYNDHVRAGSIHPFRNLNIKPLETAPPGLVWLSTEALSPSDTSVLQYLNYDDKDYQTFFRGGYAEYDALKQVLPKIKNPKKLAFAVGVEFPSTRMLNYMHKGVTIDSLLKTINLLYNYGHVVWLLYITDWPSLEDQDLVEAEEFFKSLDDVNDELTLHRFRRLLIHPNMDFKCEKSPESDWPYFWGYRAILDKKQEALNQKWIELLSTRQNLYNLRKAVI